MSCNFSFGMSKGEGFCMSGSYPNTREEDCLPSTQHVPFDFDVSRVLTDVDTAKNVKVHTILGDENKPADLTTEREP